jgi:DNA repair protein RecN (Recombination protein N)
LVRNNGIRAFMLSALSLRDLVLIDRLDLSLSAGFTALTGETGAGKSIILDGLGLALGGRGDRGLVRAGAAQAIAQAAFVLSADHPARLLLEQAGLDPAPEEDLTLRRVLSADGKSKAFVNDQPVSAALLSAIGATLAEVHGQRATHGLLQPAGHRRLLDEFGGLQSQAARCAEAYEALRAAQSHCAQLRAAQEEAVRDLDYLTHATAELAAFGPQAGEEDKLTAERALLSGAAKLIEDLQAIEDALGRDGGAENALCGALRRLERLQRTHAAHAAHPDSPLTGLLTECGDSLSRALDMAADACGKIEVALDLLRFQPGRLEALDERLHDLRALARKHHCRPDALPDVRADMERRLQVCAASSTNFSAAQAEETRCAKAYEAAAKALSAKRRAAATALDKAVAKELAPLKLDKARFETAFESLSAPSPDGAERVAFLLAANPGAPLAPLQNAASGGELARIALALKAALAQSSGPCLLVFDEIDQGVGGATADAIGVRLSRLSKSAQVLAITHSPQVAARADLQWRIEKRLAGGQMRTRVSALNAKDRDEELARMLSGANVTAAARKAAKALRAA